MNGNRNQSATGEKPSLFDVSLMALQLAINHRLARLYLKCLQKDLNLQPSGNECISGAVEHSFSGHKLPGNQITSAEHRAKGRAKIATEPQSWGAR